LYLDADTLVRADIGSAFGCPAEFCAVMRHSELVNTGVFVAAPSASRHAAMAAAAVDTPSYTGGDQGFLNSWCVTVPLLLLRLLRPACSCCRYCYHCYHCHHYHYHYHYYCPY